MHKLLTIFNFLPLLILRALPLAVLPSEAQACLDVVAKELQARAFLTWRALPVCVRTLGPAYPACVSKHQGSMGVRALITYKALQGSDPTPATACAGATIVVVTSADSEPWLGTSQLPAPDEYDAAGTQRWASSSSSTRGPKDQRADGIADAASRTTLPGRSRGGTKLRSAR